MRPNVFAAVVCLSVLALCASVAAQAPVRRATSIPAQQLGPALQSLAKERNIALVCRSELVAGRNTSGATGDLTLDEALTQLLSGTGLAFRYLNEKTVTVLPLDREDASRPATRRDIAGPAGGVEVIQLAKVDVPQSADEGRAAGLEKERQAGGEQEEIRVTGSRIRRDPAETDISPVTVFTRQDIERSGAVVIADFVGRITQASSDPGVNRETYDDPTSGHTLVNLRGLGNNTTLVLLNGRRMPKSGQGFGSDDYNLNGIPLASVERIEVLTNSASAIYGSDAIGGVINIITRSNFNGVNLSVQYGNTFDTDVSEKSANLTFGSNGALRDGRNKYSLTVALGANERNKMTAADRPYTALGDYAASGGALPLQSSVFVTVGGAGSVSTQTSYYDPTPLPGLTSNFVGIPSGQDGRNLTAADFIGVPVPPPVPLSAAEFRVLLSPSEDHSAALTAALNLLPRLQLFAEGSYSQSSTAFTGPPPAGSMLPVPAQNPYNPFGVPVFVSKVFYELGPSYGVNESSGSRIAAGLRGEFLKSWQYELYGDYNRYLGKVANPVPSALVSFYPRYEYDSSGQLIITETPVSIALAATDPARALNLFGDGRTTQPNSEELLRTVVGMNNYEEDSETTSAAFQADGVLARMPGGILKLAVGGEYRQEKVGFRKENNLSRMYVSLNDGAKRDLSAAFAELSVPLVGEHQRIPGVRLLQLSLAGRLDSESLFGNEFTPKAGMLWRPMTGVALRATYGYGYKTPNLKQLFEPILAAPGYTFPYPVDPVTGEVLSGLINLRLGGNPDLKPEHSESWSAGFICEPAWLPQFSVSADYYDIHYTDRVSGYVSGQDVLDFFPGRVERDPLTGRVTGLDTRAINLSATHATGFDIRAVHRLSTAAYGIFDSQLNYTYNLSNTQQTTPTSATVENIDRSAYPRVRANASLFWSRGGLELGPTVTYESSTANSLYGGATAPVRIRHAVVMDMQGSFDFSERGRGTRFAEWTGGLKFTLGINNVFDRTPSPTDGDGGYAKVDPRQRRYYISLHKAF